MLDVLHYNAARVSGRVRTGSLVLMMLLGLVVAWQEKAEQRLNSEICQWKDKSSLLSPQQGRKFTTELWTYLGRRIEGG